jgi:hypothetical protein
MIISELDFFLESKTEPGNFLINNLHVCTYNSPSLSSKSIEI